ncbi:hypothetical protein V8F20_008779 [Naviculisporaceae sp. PSN 640]
MSEEKDMSPSSAIPKSGHATQEPHRRLSLDSSWSGVGPVFHPPSELPRLGSRPEPSGDSGSDELVTVIRDSTAATTREGDGENTVVWVSGGEDPESLQSYYSRSSTVTWDAGSHVSAPDYWSSLSHQYTEAAPSLLDTAMNWHSVGKLVIAAMGYGVNVVDCTTVRYGELIGAGANMTVYKGTVGGRAVALKRVRPFVNQAGQRRDKRAVLSSIETEIRIMSDVFLNDHENVAKLQAFTWETSKDGELVPVIIMDLAVEKYPTLDLYMQTVDPLDFGAKGWIISDIISGLAAIHEEKIVHGDLKPENILLFNRRGRGGALDDRTPPVVAKISDFGFCEDTSWEEGPSPEGGAGGTEYWNAPECMPEAPDQMKPFARSAIRDVYSFGLIVWYVLSSRLPFGPASGVEWERNRASLRERKLSGKIAAEYFEWHNEHIRMVFRDKESVEFFDAELEEDLPALDLASRSMVEKIKRDPVFKSQVVFDELLFRGDERVTWALKTADGAVGRCDGYLPAMVPIAVLSMLGLPQRRPPTSQLLHNCKIFRGRKPAKIYDYVSRFPAGGREVLGGLNRVGWDQWTSAFRGMFAPARGIRTLSPEMRASLLRELHKDADGPSPPAGAVLILFLIYQVGYCSVPDRALARTYLTKAVDLLEGTKASDGVISEYIRRYYSEGWFRQTSLDPEKELHWALRMFSRAMPGETAAHDLSRQAFEDVLEEALCSFNDWHSVSRFLKLCTSAYIQHQVRKEVNRTDNILLEPEDDSGVVVPEIRGSWVPALLSNSPEAFEALQESGALPVELRLHNADIDSVLFMLAGMRLLGPGGIQPNLVSGFGQRAMAENNLLEIAAEHGLDRLMRHLISKYRLKIDRKLDSGYNVLQEVLEQGRLHRALMLLACGADLLAVGERDFIKHICGDGHYSAIDFWSQLKMVYQGLQDRDPMSWISMDHYRNIYRLFNENDNMDLQKQAYHTDGTPPRPAAPIYFSIRENCWQTFLALLRYGVDSSGPCMGSFDALRTSVVLVRPMFVATLCVPEYKQSFHNREGEPSLLHLAALGKDYFTNDKTWVYGSTDEISEDREAAARDPVQHQGLILELIYRNLESELEQRDRYGLTPFLLAVLQRNIAVAEWFSGKGSDVEATAADGCNALHLAIASTSKEMVTYVLARASHLLEAEDATGQTALHFAACCHMGSGVLEQILAHDPDLEAVDALGRTAPLVSLERGPATSFATLVCEVDKRLGRARLTALLNTEDAFGRTCFHFLPLLQPSSLQVIEQVVPFDIAALLRRQPNPGAARCTWTPAHLATLGTSRKLLQTFGNRSDINARGYRGITCLHLAHYLEDKSLVKELRSLGAKKNAKDDSGRVPRDFDTIPRGKQSRARALMAIMMSFDKQTQGRLDELAPLSCLLRTWGHPISPRSYLPEFKASPYDVTPWSMEAEIRGPILTVEEMFA